MRVLRQAIPPPQDSIIIEEILLAAYCYLDILDNCHYWAYVGA